jgi:hypothetical protein
MQGNDTKPDPFQEYTRPLGVTLLSIILMVFSLFQIIKVFQVINYWNFLNSLDLTISPLMQTGEGLFWALGGLILTWGFWKGRSWSAVSLVISCLLFALVSWVKLIWINEPFLLQTRWPVNLALTIIGLGSLFGFLNLKSTRSYLRRNAVKIP